MSETYFPLFVYGTLLRGERAHDLIAADIDRIDHAVLPGASLFDLGVYPMALSGSGVVQGEVCWLMLDSYQDTLQFLDNYEGPQYTRELRRIRVDGSAAGSGPKPAIEIDAWVYVGKETPNRASVIPSGVWHRRQGA